MSLQWKIAAVLVALTLGTAAAAGGEIRVIQQVATTCPSDSADQKGHDIDFSLPLDVAFQVGHRAAGAPPLTARIGAKEFGAASDKELVVLEPDVKLLVGISGKVRLRLVISDNLFCSGTKQVEASFKVTDRNEKLVKVRFVPAERTATVLDDEGRKEALEAIFDTHKAAIYYLAGPEQLWLSDYLKAVEDDDYRVTFGARFCNKCTWPAQQRLAYALAKFIDANPYFMKMRNLIGDEIEAEIMKPAKFKCSLSWQYPITEGGGLSSDEDGILRLYPKGSPESYLQLRSRRSLPSGMLGLERIVIDGASIGEGCE